MRPKLHRSDDRSSGSATGGRSPRRIAHGLAAAVATAAVALGVGAASASALVVTVTLTGSEAGRVVSAIPGIDCSNIPAQEKTDCVFDFPSVMTGTDLTATGGPGAAFMRWGGNGGGTCADGVNPCRTSLLNGFFPLNIEARFGPEPEAPSVVTGGASDVAFPSARVSGGVNPNSNAFALTECRFEYGPTSSYGKWAPCRPPVTSGVNMAGVSTTLGVLEPDTTYHYRLVASNGGGRTVGDDKTLTTGPAPVDNCSNAFIRAQQGALGRALPDCMAYELTSPEFTSGQRASTLGMSDDGNMTFTNSAGGFADVENLPDTGVSYRSFRTATGWQTKAIAPPAKDFPFIGTWGMVDASEDMRRTLWYVTLKADEGTGQWTPIVGEEDGTFSVAGPTLPVGVPHPAIVGTSADLDTVVTSTIYRPALTDGTVDTRPSVVSRYSLQVSSRDDDGNLEVKQLAYRAGATMFPNCPVDLGGQRTARAAISADGSKIIFSAGGFASCRTAANQRVWAKVGDADPIDLSESRCTDGNCGAAAQAIYAGAARDGSRVYFTSQQKLVDGDQDTAGRNDIYEYDFSADGEKLRPVTASLDPVGADVVAVTRISDDGSHVYFVAKGRPLAGANARGASPQPGGQNLYVYHREQGEGDGSTAFIGQLSTGEMALPPFPAMTSSTGRHLLFASTANLTGEKQAGDAFADLYRYDTRTDELRRIWSDDPARNGANRIGGMDFLGIREAAGASGGMQMSWDGIRAMSDDGATIALATDEPLSPWDVNLQPDVYMWRANTGQFTLLTSGAADAVSGFPRWGVTNYTGMTPSGDSVFFNAYTPLLASHRSGQTASFVVRRDGGFVDTPTPPVCVGDACQGPGATSPGSPDIGTTKDSDSGNVPVAPRGELSASAPPAVRGTRVVLRVKAPGRGRLKLSGGAVRASVKTVGRAGSYRIAVRLTPSAVRKLRTAGRLKVRVGVAFRPVIGASSSQTVSVTFRTQKAGRKGGR
jgi:hypothetical protein